jgi:hypothetical protein
MPIAAVCCASCEDLRLAMILFRGGRVVDGDHPLASWSLSFDPRAE